MVLALLPLIEQPLPLMQRAFCKLGVCTFNTPPHTPSIHELHYSYLAIFACFFVWPFTTCFGRRWSIALASLIFCIGGIVQIIKTHSLATFYVARVNSGISVGSKQLKAHLLMLHVTVSQLPTNSYSIEWY